MRFEVWGLSGTLETEHAETRELARATLWKWIARADASVNRFLEASEISVLNHAQGRVTSVSSDFERFLHAALEANRVTGGLSDPTVLTALTAWGYDRDYDLLEGVTRRVPERSAPTPGVAAITWDAEAHTVTLRDGALLDFGSSAKAVVADAIADELAPHGGVLVELGGDVAVRGTSGNGPWIIAVSSDGAERDTNPKIALPHGGVATSSTANRVWRTVEGSAHHLIDPRTGAPALSQWKTVTVSAIDCATANAYATAAFLWDGDAPYEIAQAGWSARLVDHNNHVLSVGGWPEEGPQ